MKASELIEKLNNAVSKVGDMEILIHVPSDGWSTTDIDVFADPPSEAEKELGIGGTIDIACVDDSSSEYAENRNYMLYDLLKSHFGHQVEIAIYGDVDCPSSVTLEDMDTNSIILDTELYTITERTDI